MSRHTRSWGAILLLLVLVTGVASQAGLMEATSLVFGTDEEARDAISVDPFVVVLTYHPGTTTSKLYSVSHTGGTIVDSHTVSTSATDEGMRITSAFDGSTLCVACEGTSLRCYGLNLGSGDLTDGSTTAGPITGNAFPGATSLAFVRYEGRAVASAGRNEWFEEPESVYLYQRGKYVYATSTTTAYVTRFLANALGFMSGPTHVNVGTAISGTCVNAAGGGVTVPTGSIDWITSTPDELNLVLSWRGVDAWIALLGVDSDTGDFTSCFQRYQSSGHGLPVPAITNVNTHLSVTSGHIMVSSGYYPLDNYAGAPRDPFTLKLNLSLFLETFEPSPEITALALMADETHLYTAPSSGDVVHYVLPDVTAGTHRTGYGEVGAFSEAFVFFPNTLDTLVHLLVTQGGQATLHTMERDMETLMPTLMSPMPGLEMGESMSDGINVTYVLPESAAPNMTQLHLQPMPSGDEITITIVGTSSRSFMLSYSALEQELSGNVAGEGITIPPGMYNVSLSYQDASMNARVTTEMALVCLNTLGTCIGCPAGTYYLDASECANCPIGTANAVVNGTCEACNETTQVAPEGSETCTTCDPEYVPNEAGDECASVDGEEEGAGEEGGTMTLAETVGAPTIVIAGAVGAAGGGIAIAALWAAFWAAPVAV